MAFKNKIEAKFDNIRSHSTILDQIPQSNSNSETKFDLEFEIRNRHFSSNSELFQVEFEIRPSLIETLASRNLRLKIMEMFFRTI
jgi:hypothetical protein